MDSVCVCVCVCVCVREGGRELIREMTVSVNATTTQHGTRTCNHKCCVHVYTCTVHVTALRMSFHNVAY